jgi:magnesium chelatase family protein
MLEKIYGVENITVVIDFFDRKTALEQNIIDVHVEFNKSLDNLEFDFAALH